MNGPETELANSNAERLGWMELVRQYVVSLRYGTVQITVHDSQVTQVDKTERVRIQQPPGNLGTVSQK